MIIEFPLKQPKHTRRLFPIVLLQSGKNKSSQHRGKEEESDTACCIGTPEHCGLVRRDLVVCPPPGLLPGMGRGTVF